MTRHCASAATALVALLATGAILVGPTAAAAPPRNVVLFVPDGLRPELVTPQSAPHLARIASEGVRFANAHALFPTLGIPNAAALATGEQVGDHGLYGDVAYEGAPLAGEEGEDSLVPLVEDDPNLAAIAARHAAPAPGHALAEAVIAAGYSAAFVGKYGAVAVGTSRVLARGAILIDDRTGRPGGVDVPKVLRERMAGSGLSVLAPGRGDNGDAGNLREHGTRSINAGQQNWFSAVTTRAVLPELKARRRPFLLVYWSRDPDGTTHNQGDSHRSLEPGINGPTSLAAVRDADRALGEIEESLEALGLAGSTDIIVASDHGFSRVAHDTQTSPSAKRRYRGVVQGELPPGFLAMDLAEGLSLPIADADGAHEAIDPAAGHHPADGSALIGADPAAPEVIVAANGGADLLYLPGHGALELAPRIVTLLLAQDYVSGIFVDERHGPLPGTLPLAAIGLSGGARTPRPDIVVSFRSYTTGCNSPLLCTVLVADSTHTTGQGVHGSASRADTAIYAAARGPDFKAGYVDLAPVSVADLGRTIATLFRLHPVPSGASRVLGESLPGGADVVWSRQSVRGPAAPGGLATEIVEQRVGETRYVTAGGFRGRTVGLPAGDGE